MLARDGGLWEMPVVMGALCAPLVGADGGHFALRNVTPDYFPELRPGDPSTPLRSGRDDIRYFFGGRGRGDIQSFVRRSFWWEFSVSDV
jgi:hypothetical protein